MSTNKAGTILLNKKNKKICLIARKDGNGYEFPKGHLEGKETLQECAVRETKEETMHNSHLESDIPLGVIQYENENDGYVYLYIYVAIDDGKTTDSIKEKDKEKCEWFDFDEVKNKLAFQNLIDLWDSYKDKIKEILEK